MAQQDEANVINGTLAVSKHQLSFARHRIQLLNAIVFCFPRFVIVGFERHAVNKFCGLLNDICVLIEIIRVAM